jgi:hypothetical protein
MSTVTKINIKFPPIANKKEKRKKWGHLSNVGKKLLHYPLETDKTRQHGQHTNPLW